MTPIFMNQPLYPEEPNEVQPPPQASYSSSTSFSSPIFLNPSQDQGVSSYASEQQQQQQQEVPSDIHQFLPSPLLPTVETESDYGLKLSISKGEDKDSGQRDNRSSVKWMSSKMRLMKKMMKNSNRMVAENPIITSNKKKLQDQQRSPNTFHTDNSSNNSSSNNNNNTVIRVCSDCNTTKTPLWRSGPRGPKSLCNACGIRQRKARRAMAAAAAAANGTLLGTDQTSSMVQQEEKISNNGYITQYKKKCKLTATPQSKKKLRFEDFTISLSKNSAFHRVFPQDEKDAAILLMALSCGLVHG